MEQDNPLFHEIQQRAEEDIIDDQRRTAEMTTRSYEQRKRVYDAVDHKLESAVLGTVEIVDRENGTRYKISDFDDFHFVSTDGYIYSANAPGASGNDIARDADAASRNLSLRFRSCGAASRSRTPQKRDLTLSGFLA